MEVVGENATLDDNNVQLDFKSVNNGFKFSLDPTDLSKSNISLSEGEKIIWSWQYDSEALTLAEYYISNII